MGTTQWAARAERLLGRIAVAEGDEATAREQFESALDLLGEVDAPQDELATLRLLLERARERGDEAATEHWREQIDECVEDAPDIVANQEWLATLE
jgi:hypothetical protein